MSSDPGRLRSWFVARPWPVPDLREYISEDEKGYGFRVGYAEERVAVFGEHWKGG